MSHTFLVTGASKGIGLALSRRLAGDGHHVVGVARRQVESFPGTFVTLDLGDTAATVAALADLAGRFAIDGVVNNVGLVRPQRLGEIDLPALAEVVMRVNLHPAVQAVQAVLPGPRERGWGGSPTCPA